MLAIITFHPGEWKNPRPWPTSYLRIRHLATASESHLRICSDHTWEPEGWMAMCVLLLNNVATKRSEIIKWKRPLIFCLCVCNSRRAESKLYCMFVFDYCPLVGKSCYCHQHLWKCCVSRHWMKRLLQSLSSWNLSLEMYVKALCRDALYTTSQHLLGKKNIWLVLQEDLLGRMIVKNK